MTATKGRRLAQKEPGNYLALIWIGAWFFLGIALGIGLTTTLSPSTGAEIAQYLKSYVTLSQEPSWVVIVTMLKLYFTPVLAVFFLGFVSIGVVLLPGLTVVYSGLLSFGIAVCIATFGRDGLWIALALLGVRCLVGLPCYLWLALQANQASWRLTQACLGWKKGTSLGYQQGYYMRLGLWILVILLGICMDCMLSPHLLAWAVMAWI